MNENACVTCSIDECVAVVTVNREPALNALNMDVLAELRRVFTDLGKRSFEELRVVILKGAGEKAFVAGADIKLMREASNAGRKEFIELGQEVMSLVESVKFPVIAVVPGFALGGGMELALACDIIVSSEKGLFGQPEVNLGLIPGFGGTQRLQRRVGIGAAKTMIFTGDPVPAARALEMGLVDVVCPPSELESVARKMANTIKSRGPLAVASAKKVMHEPSSEVLERGLKLEVEQFLELFEYSDTNEGLSAFIEKRPANFTGRQ